VLRRRVLRQLARVALEALADDLYDARRRFELAIAKQWVSSQWS
jgi:hypothetical protein